MEHFHRVSPLQKHKALYSELCHRKHEEENLAKYCHIRKERFILSQRDASEQKIIAAKCAICHRALEINCGDRRK